MEMHGLIQEVIEFLDLPPTITIRVQEGLPAVRCERTRMHQIFQNLLHNATKFMDKPQGDIRVTCADEGAQWRFSVQDNGPGIARQHQERIFQMFQTLTPRDEKESTGIGLAFVRKVVETAGGRIWVDSVVGEGSTFHFTWPKEPPLGPEPETTPHAFTAAHSSHRG